MTASGRTNVPLDPINLEGHHIAYYFAPIFWGVRAWPAARYGTHPKFR